MSWICSNKKSFEQKWFQSLFCPTSLYREGEQRPSVVCPKTTPMQNKHRWLQLNTVWFPPGKTKNTGANLHEPQRQHSANLKPNNDFSGLTHSHLFLNQRFLMIFLKTHSSLGSCFLLCILTHGRKRTDLLLRLPEPTGSYDKQTNGWWRSLSNNYQRDNNQKKKKNDPQRNRESRKRTSKDAKTIR